MVHLAPLLIGLPHPVAYLTFCHLVSLPGVVVRDLPLPTVSGAPAFSSRLRAILSASSWDSSMASSSREAKVADA